MYPLTTVSPRPYCRSRRGRNGLGSETTGFVNANRNIDFNHYMPLKTNCTLIFQAITVDYSNSRIIDSLIPKTSTGVNSVSNKLLKFDKIAISEPLTIIIN